MHHRPSLHPHSTSTTLNLFIPSLYDSTALEASLLVPTSAPTTRRAAIIAHPYGPLGGTLHDGAVQHLAFTLLSHGYIVALFNFRGAGHSKGHTTWTGKAETADYAAVAAWVLNFVAALGGCEAPSTAPLQLLLAGYSYGALIAAQCPRVATLRETLANPPSDAFRSTVAAGTSSALKWFENHSDVGRTSYSGVRSPRTSYSGMHSGSESRPLPPPPLAADLGAIEIATQYLLLSPPLPPVSAFLLPSFFAAAESAMDPAAAAVVVGADGVLVAWGDDDVFTSVKKYRRWAEKMRAQLGKRFVGVEVQGTGHFWAERELAVVDEALGRWLRLGCV
jgi:alpha/beta superfamily hydrolase